MKKVTKKTTARKRGRPPKTDRQRASEEKKAAKKTAKRIEKAEKKAEDELVEAIINPITSIKVSESLELAVIEMQAKGYTYEQVCEELGDNAPSKVDYAKIQNAWEMSPDEFVRLQSKKYQLLENKLLDNVYRNADILEPHQASMALARIADLRATNMGMPSNITATVNFNAKKRDLKALLANDVPAAIEHAKKVDNG
jgi:hypothetical protein